VFATDLLGRYTYVNRQVQVLLGAPLEGIVGRCDSDFFGPELVKRNREREQRVLRDGIPVSGQERGVVLSDGQSRAFWTVKSPLRDGDSQVVGFCGISLDITEHLLLENNFSITSTSFVYWQRLCQRWCGSQRRMMSIFSLINAG
jgi:PAS domain S-box-containing protein